MKFNNKHLLYAIIFGIQNYNHADKYPKLFEYANKQLDKIFNILANKPRLNEDICYETITLFEKRDEKRLAKMKKAGKYVMSFGKVYFTDSDFEYSLQCYKALEDAIFAII